MEKKKLVLPGEHLLSCEEAEPGENTFSEKDEIYSAAFGEPSFAGGTASVVRKRRTITKPHVGMEVYCTIVKTSPNKAIASCIPVKGAEKSGSAMDIRAVLPVTALGKRGYVKDLRDEIKIGDIVKAEIKKITSTGIDITIAGPQHGFMCVFCPRCRNAMHLKAGIFICNSCKWKERRKVPRDSKD